MWTLIYLPCFFSLVLILFDLLVLPVLALIVVNVFAFDMLLLEMFKDMLTLKF